MLKWHRLCKYMYVNYYNGPQRSWGKVMFSQACVILFTGEGVSASVHAGIHTPPPPGADNPPQSILGDTVNARAVRILLECNLVIGWNRWPGKKLIL